VAALRAFFSLVALLGSASAATVVPSHLRALPSLLPLAESVGLCAIGAAGVACGVLLARRA
jgi:hypothetical protein